MVDLDNTVVLDHDRRKGEPCCCLSCADAAERARDRMNLRAVDYRVKLAGISARARDVAILGSTYRDAVDGEGGASAYGRRAFPLVDAVARFDVPWLLRQRELLLDEVRKQDAELKRLTELADEYLHRFSPRWTKAKQAASDALERLTADKSESTEKFELMAALRQVVYA